MIGVAIFVTLHFLPGSSNGSSRSPRSPRTIPAPGPGSAAAASPTPPIPSTTPRTSLSSCSIRCRSTPTARGSGSRPWRTPCWWRWCSLAPGAAHFAPGGVRPPLRDDVRHSSPAHSATPSPRWANLGLITREAVVTVPFFLVVLCIPRGPRHRPPRYVWELRRRERVARRKALARRAGVSPPRRAVSHLSGHHRVQGGSPALGHEIQAELRFAPAAGRLPHGDSDGPGRPGALRRPRPSRQPSRRRSPRYGRHRARLPPRARVSTRLGGRSVPPRSTRPACPRPWADW